MIPRKVRLARGGPIKKRPRKSSEWTRIYGSKARVAWIKSLGCLVATPFMCDGPIQNAHTASSGMGRKADADSIVPLCALHHRALHRHGAATFEWVHGISLSECAARTAAAWEARCAT